MKVKLFFILFMLLVSSKISFEKLTTEESNKITFSVLKNHLIEKGSDKILVKIKDSEYKEFIVSGIFQDRIKLKHKEEVLQLTPAIEGLDIGFIFVD